MSKARAIIAICILIAGLFGYLIGKQSTNNIAPATNDTQLNLPYEQVKVSGVDNIQQKQVEDFISKFYEYQQQREVDKAIALFTPPVNKQEQDDLDFLLDAQKYNYTLGAHYIRAITRHKDTITVLVDEMRTLYSGGEYVGYIAIITRKGIDLVQRQDLKIAKYYDLQSSNKKYSGFIAN